MDDFFHDLEDVGVMALLSEVHGTARPRAMVPGVPDVVLDSLKTRLGMESRHALPAWLVSEEALRPLVGFNAPQGRQGLGQRGATTRPGERVPGPICPATVATQSVKVKGRDREAVFKGAMRALARAGVVGAQVTGMVAGTELATTERSVGCGQVTRHVRQADQQGRVHEIEVTVSGWKVLLLIEAVTTIPLAVQVAPIDAPETHWTRALVTPARAHLAGAARLHTSVVDRGLLEGTDVWWLDEPGLLLGVPANTHRAGTVEARAPAAAGEGLSRGCRVPTVRHGQGKTARPERLTTEVVGITGLTTADQDGTAEPRRHAHRRDCQPNRLHAVVVRQWHGRDYGPGGKTVLLTHAAVQQPLQPCDDDDARRLRAHGCMKEAKQPWELGHPPRKVRGRCAGTSSSPC